jgi:hypothetical protein
MEIEFVTILQKLVAERGRENLLNSAKCKALLSDYTHNEYKKESRLLLQTLDAGVQMAIETTENIAICKKQQIKLLHEEYCLDEKVAIDVVDTIALVLKGDTSITTMPNVNSENNKSTSNRIFPRHFPDFVINAINNTSEDNLVGIGKAKLASASQTMIISATRARAEISRQMITLIQDMVREYQVSSKVNKSAALSFQENITAALSKSTLVGSRIVDADFDDTGSCWTIIQLSKLNILEEINYALAVAKQTVPAMASFYVEDWLSEAFDKLYIQEVSVGDK